MERLKSSRKQMIQIFPPFAQVTNCLSCNHLGTEFFSHKQFAHLFVDLIICFVQVNHLVTPGIKPIVFIVLIAEKLNLCRRPDWGRKRGGEGERQRIVQFDNHTIVL